MPPGEDYPNRELRPFRAGAISYPGGNGGSAPGVAMFVPVACLTCGKPFQVPRNAAGTDVACPWCRAATPALPVAGVATAPPPEPLSLDDAEPLPEPPPPRPSFRAPYRTLIAGSLLMLVVSFATVAVLRYGTGRIPGSAWAGFLAPDGSCTVELPGEPVGEKLDPLPGTGVTRGGERYVTTGWYSGARAWVGWWELDPGFAKQAAADRDGLLTAPVLNAARAARKEQAGGEVTRTGTIRSGPHLGMEVQMTTPRGRLVERYVVVAGGPRPRLYVVGIEAKNLNPDGPAARRVLGSFRVVGE